MEKYTAEVLEDALSLVKIIMYFCGISYLVWWHNFNPAWYLLLFLLNGYILMDNYIAKKKLEKELEEETDN